MDGKNGMLLWVLGGAGVLLMYSAYKNQNPQTVLAAHLTGTIPAPAVPASPGVAGAAPTAGYSVRPDGSGLVNVFDRHGNMAGVVPAPYQNRSRSWIPPQGLVNV